MYHLSKLPWAFILLALGIVLAGIAFVLAALSHTESIFAFIFAGLALLGGIVTLMLQHIRETRRVPERPEERVLRVYRKTPCPLDAAIYERLVESSNTLEQEIKGKNWEYDATAYQVKLNLAAAEAKQNRYREAFREQCRAMLVLMEAVHLYRGKNEDFKPLWDRPAG
jgi:hypothetical protein